MIYLPFDLHPEYPPEGILRKNLEKRYGPGIHDHTRRLIEGAGFTYDPPEVIPNSKHALELSELARDQNKFDQVHRSLFRAYWSEHRDIGDRAVLAEIATTAGLDPGDAEAAFDDGRYLERIQYMTATALSLGVNGVPAWLIDDKMLVPGAQPHAVFERALIELGHELRPSA